VTLALDLEIAQEAINQHGEKIRGIFPIHPLGNAMSPNGLEEFIKKNQLVLINDVCESLRIGEKENMPALQGLQAHSHFIFLTI